MATGWGPLAGVCGILLLLAGAWPRLETRIASTAQTLVDPATARYDYFNPADASLKLVQVVFRHGARTPLNTIYTFPGVSWTHCRDHYQGVEVELHDENGGPQAPPILDVNTPELPGGCRQGTLTEAGYKMALEVGAWLRNRYVSASSTSSGGFLPDLGPEARTAAAGPMITTAASMTLGPASLGWDSAVATLRTTPIRRTVATLRGVLTGLWPRLGQAATAAAGLRFGLGTERQQLPGAPAWNGGAGGVEGPMLLPVGASLESMEIMYGNNNTCARLAPLHAAMQMDLDAADARDSELPRLSRQVAEALGLDTNKPILWPKLYDHLAGMIADGAPMPVGATQEVLDIVWSQAERHEAGVIAPSADLCAALGPGGADGSNARHRRCHEVLRLGIGMLVRRLLDNMEASVQAAASTTTAAAAAPTPRPPSKLYLFSGHDSSLMPLLAVLGQPARAWPPFASHLVFELWQSATGAATAASPTSQLLLSRATAAVGRRGGSLLEAAAEPGGAVASGSGSGRGGGGREGSGSKRQSAQPEFWLRVLYNGAPLVVPGLSNTDGWAPLASMRQRVLLPYAIGPEEHTAMCSNVDISDLDVQQKSSTADAAAAARERSFRHAML